MERKYICYWWGASKIGSLVIYYVLVSSFRCSPKLLGKRHLWSRLGFSLILLNNGTTLFQLWLMYCCGVFVLIEYLVDQFCSNCGYHVPHMRLGVDQASHLRSHFLSCLGGSWIYLLFTRFSNWISWHKVTSLTSAQKKAFEDAFVFSQFHDIWRC